MFTTSTTAFTHQRVNSLGSLSNTTTSSSNIMNIANLDNNNNNEDMDWMNNFQSWFLEDENLAKFIENLVPQVNTTATNNNVTSLQQQALLNNCYANNNSHTMMNNVGLDNEIQVNCNTTSLNHHHSIFDNANTPQDIPHSNNSKAFASVMSSNTNGNNNATSMMDNDLSHNSIVLASGSTGMYLDNDQLSSSCCMKQPDATSNNGSNGKCDNKNVCMNNNSSTTTNNNGILGVLLQSNSCSNKQQQGLNAATTTTNGSTSPRIHYNNQMQITANVLNPTTPVYHMPISPRGAMNTTTMNAIHVPSISIATPSNTYMTTGFIPQCGPTMVQPIIFSTANNNLSPMTNGSNSSCNSPRSNNSSNTSQQVLSNTFNLVGNTQLPTSNTVAPTISNINNNNNVNMQSTTTTANTTTPQQPLWWFNNRANYIKFHEYKGPKSKKKANKESLSSSSGSDEEVDANKNCSSSLLVKGIEKPTASIINKRKRSNSTSSIGSIPLVVNNQQQQQGKFTLEHNLYNEYKFKTQCPAQTYYKF
ncbi:hypothetical protein ABK040_016074 [Willaertia magna]